MTGNDVQPLRVNKLSLSAQAQQYLLDLIEQGTYEPGEQLPSENELATRLGISRPTLREALHNLEQEGMVIRKHGVGTFVAPGYEHRLESGLECLESILDLAARQGLQLKFNALQILEEPADAALAEKLDVAPGTPATHIRRVIEVDRRPVAYMVDIVPSTVLSPPDLDAAFTGSVLDLLRNKQDLHIDQAVAEIVALDADDTLARELGIQTGRAILLLEETLYDQTGVILEFSQNYFIPEFFRFQVVRR